MCTRHGSVQVLYVVTTPSYVIIYYAYMGHIFGWVHKDQFYLTNISFYYVIRWQERILTDTSLELTDF